MKEMWNSKDIIKEHWRKEKVYPLWEYRDGDFYCEDSIFWHKEDAEKWLEEHGYKYVKRKSYWVDKDDEEQEIEKGNFFIIKDRIAWKKM